MSETADIAALIAKSLYVPQTFNANEGREFIALPNGNGTFKLEQITSRNKAEVLMPKVVTQHVKMQTALSLEDYVNRFKNADTVLFADITADKIEAILDYHRMPTANLPKPPSDAKAVSAAAVSDIPSATLGEHRALLHLPKSLEWQTWTGASGKLMRHVDFATFLEENSIDVVAPVGGDLLELCRDLQAKGDYSFNSAVRMGDVTELEYAKKSDATTKGGMTMPTQVHLSIPVYFGEQRVSVTAFMRRKIDDGALFLGFQLSRAENVRQDEFHRIVDALNLGVGHLTTVYGTPA